MRDAIDELAGMADGHDDRPTIRIERGQLHQTANMAEDALVQAQAPFYVRGDTLVRPAIDDVEASKGRRTKIARLCQVQAPTILDYLSREARFEKYDGRAKGDGIVPTDPPRTVADIILARDGEWRFPRIAGVLTTPTLRPDGSMLSEPGYDPATRLYLGAVPPMPPLGKTPTKDDALAALALIDGRLNEFPFVDDASRSVALSAILSPVVRGALDAVPMHAITAPTPGSGKSFLIDLVAAVATGQRCPVMTAGENEAETEKRLAAALMAGQSIVSIDNMNGVLGGDLLCQMVERPLVETRVLGASIMRRIENRSCIFATGNNIALRGDMTRRVVLCQLDPDLERPELRQFGGNPFAEILADRGAYIAAALTIVRAYVVAGCPNQASALASFEDWSRLVRSALIWLGRADPVETMEAARVDDPETQQLQEVVETWLEAAGPNNPMTTGQMISLANEMDRLGSGEAHDFGTPQDRYPEFQAALMSVAVVRGAIDAKRLGHWLGRNNGRVVGRAKIVRDYDSHKKQARWMLAQNANSAGIAG